MKLTSKVLASAFTALTFAMVPACDDKKEDKKGDKKDDKKDAKKDDKKDEKKDGDKAAADDGAKADDGGEKAAADGEKADGGDDGAAADGGGEAAADGIGVPECDEYIANYTKCIDEKMPEAARETSHKALATSVDAWKKAAATPAGKEGLATACKTAAEAVKASCGW